MFKRSSDWLGLTSSSDSTLAFTLDETGPLWIRPPEAHADQEAPPETETLLTGVLTIRLAKPRKFAFVRILLLCTSEIHSRSASGTVTREAFRKELMHRIEGDTLPIGEHRFSFAFQLPATASPSAKSRHGEVTWELSARASGPSGVLTAKAPIEVCSVQPGSDIGERGAIQHMVRGIVADLGLFELSLIGDGHVGGRYIFELSLPSSAEGVVLRRIFLHLRQFQTLDTTSGPDDEGGVLEEPLPMQFKLFELSPELAAAQDIEWPTPGPKGCRLRHAGYLPRCQDTISWARDFVQATTPTSSRTAFRINHDIVLEIDWSIGAKSKIERLRFPKPISISSCAIATDRTHLPRYQSISSWQDKVSKRAVLCGCQRAELQGDIVPVPSRESLVK